MGMRKMWPRGCNGNFSSGYEKPGPRGGPGSWGNLGSISTAPAEQYQTAKAREQG
jgi:hypothetical protein